MLKLIWIISKYCTNQIDRHVWMLNRSKESKLGGKFISLNNFKQRPCSWRFGSYSKWKLMPCDMILLNGSCIINEAILTGESAAFVKNCIVPSAEIYD